MVDPSDEKHHDGGQGIQEGDSRIVCFPTHSQGSVGYIWPDHKSGEPPRWQPSGPARGEMIVPDGVKLALVWSPSFENLAPLDRLRPDDLYRLDLWDCYWVDDAMLAHVSRLHGLRELNLSGTGVSDEGLVHLRAMTALENLNLGHGDMTGSGIAHLRGLPALRKLVLQWARFDDDSITLVVQLPALRDLTLLTNRVTEDGIARLARKATLERLGLHAFDHLAGTGLAQLHHLPALRVLSLRNSQITDAEVAHLAGLSHLRELDLFATRVTKQGIDHLKEALPQCRIHAYSSLLSS